MRIDAWLVRVGLCCMGLCAVATPVLADATDDLKQLLADEWDRQMREAPTFASSLGDRRFNDKWPDLSAEAFERSHAADKAALERANAINTATLADADLLNLRLFKRMIQRRIELYPFKWRLVPLDHRWGIQTTNTLAERLRFTTVKDYEDWVARLESFDGYMDQTIALLRQGIAEGRVHARVVMQRLPKQIQSHIVDDPSKSLYYSPFQRLPEAVSQADAERLSTRAQTAIRDQVVPSYKKLLDFFEANYLPGASEKAGVWQWPDGDKMYAAQVGFHTSTTLTPDEVHEIGLAEVARIRKEMDDVIKQVEFKGSFEAFLTHLRTDKRYYYQNGDDLLAAYRALCKRIDPAMVKLFRTLPRTPYGVVPIPMHIAPDTTTAYYQPPAADGSRAGYYFVNLYKPETRPKYEMEALSLHEAVPGHHFQIALAMEQGALPNFRRHGGYTAYVEGWALYCETIGQELGLYEDPYSKFGQLTYEMWRAIRLVVDTGIHHKKWTRQQAIDYFKSYAAKSELDITNEIDRYIAWPGQALAYKIGQLKITELRARATKELGDQFDIKALHDVVLLSGAVPLDVLEENVNGWIAREKAKASE